MAESLIERQGFDARDQVERYRRWQQQGHLSATGQCVGITAGTARALAMSQWRRQLFSGSHDPHAQDADALARVTPTVMFFFADESTALANAAEAARTTCQAPPYWMPVGARACPARRARRAGRRRPCSPRRARVRRADPLRGKPAAAACSRRWKSSAVR